ncbi:hypothetical protein DPC6321_0083 [Bifidobacterium longum]|nr:hypothetical protein DPC6321_0083 [Bifidobacterium longum]
MKLSKSKIIGLIALLAVVGVVCGTLVWRQSQPAPAEPTEQVSITGYLGGEKIGLFDDAKFKALAAKQGIAIDYRKAGSPAMMDTDRKGMDYLFPSSRAAVEYGNAKGVKAPPKRHRLQLTDCAIHAQGRGGRARERRTCDQGRFWRVPHGYGQSRGRDGRQHNMADVGYTAGYGQFRIDSTDPVKSNSGNEYAALLATVLNGGQPAMVDSVARDGKTIASIFAKSGWMETSSEDSFNQFLTLGVGSKPMMVGYESQLLDLAVNQPDAFKQIKDDVVIVYPTPTVWSTHTLMALAEKRRHTAEPVENTGGAEAGVGAPWLPRGQLRRHRFDQPIRRGRHARPDPGRIRTAQQRCHATPHHHPPIRASQTRGRHLHVRHDVHAERPAIPRAENDRTGRQEGARRLQRQPAASAGGRGRRQWRRHAGASAEELQVQARPFCQATRRPRPHQRGYLADRAADQKSSRTRTRPSWTRSTPPSPPRFRCGRVRW